MLDNETFFLVLLENPTYFCSININSDMTSANIEQKNNTTVLYEPLADEDRKRLCKHFSKLKHSQRGPAYKNIGVAPDTVKKAMAGLDVTPGTAEKIRSFLQTVA